MRAEGIEGRKDIVQIVGEPRAAEVVEQGLDALELRLPLVGRRVLGVGVEQTSIGVLVDDLTQAEDLDAADAGSTQDTGLQDRLPTRLARRVGVGDVLASDGQAETLGVERVACREEEGG